MKPTVEHLSAAIERALESPAPVQWIREEGRVVSVGKGIVSLKGFRRVGQDELITLESGTTAMAINLDEDAVGAILLSGDVPQTGLRARRSHRRSDTPVGEALLGRVINPLGEPLDRLGTLRTHTRWPVERVAPAIMARAPVRRPLVTGITAVDAAIPIGRGQRQLILGDRQTGKTSVAINAILSQGEDVVCVYCAIGQRQSAVAKVIETLRTQGALQRCVVVVASGRDHPGLRYLAPYAATTMAEYFMEHGQDALIIYDDLTRHARAYRELSLLLRRPPGREAYPGDIFYLHARLLERATQLRAEKGGGSLSALPIIETQGGNLSAYIPTNLISITDGQIYLSPDLFERGQLPAIDVSRSVSRVGGKAQPAGYRSVAGDLKLFYAQFEELETFARFGTRLDADTHTRLERGRRVREILKQPEHETISPKQQIAIVLAATSGGLDRVPITALPDAVKAIQDHVKLAKGDQAFARLTPETPLDEGFRQALSRAISSMVEPFRGQVDGDA